MSDGDSSPEAHEDFLERMIRVSNWVSDQSQNYHYYSTDTSTSRVPLSPPSPIIHRHRPGHLRPYRSTTFSSSSSSSSTSEEGERSFEFTTPIRVPRPPMFPTVLQPVCFPVPVLNFLTPAPAAATDSYQSVPQTYYPAVSFSSLTGTREPKVTMSKLDLALLLLYERLIRTPLKGKYVPYPPISDRFSNYETLSRYLVHRALNASEVACAKCYEILISHRRLDIGVEPIIPLAFVRQMRVELLKLSVELNCRDDPELWECLRRDEAAVVNALQYILQDPRVKERLSSLSKDVAFAFLTIIDGVISGDLASEHHHTPIYVAPSDFRRRLYRISVWLCVTLLRLPESLHLQGVFLLDFNQQAGGGYADIYKGVYRRDLVALKTLRIFKQVDERQKNEKLLYREIAILHRLSHPNICAILGVDREIFPGKICLVSPWMMHGDVLEFIKSNGFEIEEVLRLLTETIRGLVYLHQEYVAHGDLRGSNILVDNERHIRLTDFGLSNFVDVSQSSACPGAMRWMAPEIHDPKLPNIRHTPASDVYSFGHVCWEIYTGQPPYSNLKHLGQVSLHVMEGNRPIRTSSPREFPDRLWDIMEQCWRHFPHERPEATVIERRLLRLSQCGGANHVPFPLPSLYPVGTGLGHYTSSRYRGRL